MANHKAMMGLICLGAVVFAGCQDTEPKATAKRVSTTELIGERRSGWGW